MTSATSPGDDATRYGARIAGLIRSGWTELWRPAPGNVAALDGARSLAVLLVIASHVGVAWQQAKLPRIAALKLPVFYFGWTGVDLFFVLSGFLIGGQLWRELDRTNDVAFGRFFLRRGFRIWPLYYFHLAFLTVFASYYVPTWPDWLLVSNYFPHGYTRGWSLSTEEHFYLVAPPLALLLFRYARQWVVPALLLTLAAVALMRFGASEALLAEGRTISDVKTKLYDPFHLHCEGLVVGLIIAYLRRELPQRLRSSVDRFGVARRSLLIMVVLVVLGGALRALNGVLFPFLALGLIYGGLLWWLLDDRSFASAPFRWRGWHLIARLSFGMYLNHLIWPHIGPSLVTSAVSLVGENAGALVLATVGAVAVSVSVAAVTFVTIEYPFLRLRDRVLSHKPA